MRNASRLVLGLAGVLAASVPGGAQELQPGPACPPPTCPAKPACESPAGWLGSCKWTAGCFPRCGCPDDYCPNPYPRQCWPPYLPFYRCVPAGECAHPPCVGVGNEKLTWWFLPTPRALREALWCRP
jgi:hypothetical protein